MDANIPWYQSDNFEIYYPKYRNNFLECPICRNPITRHVPCCPHCGVFLKTNKEKQSMLIRVKNEKYKSNGNRIYQWTEKIEQDLREEFEEKVENMKNIAKEADIKIQVPQKSDESYINTASAREMQIVTKTIHAYQDNIKQRETAKEKYWICYVTIGRLISYTWPRMQYLIPLQLSLGKINNLLATKEEPKNILDNKVLEYIGSLLELIKESEKIRFYSGLEYQIDIEKLAIGVKKFTDQTISDAFAEDSIKINATLKTLTSILCQGLTKEEVQKTIDESIIQIKKQKEENSEDVDSLDFTINMKKNKQ